MAPLLSREDFKALGGPDLVYIRAIKAKEVLGAVTAEDSSDHDITPDQLLYAVHSADGERLAVLIDRKSAFAAAAAHELIPVSVH